jgi:hypothetical protein
MYAILNTASYTEITKHMRYASCQASLSSPFCRTLSSLSPYLVHSMQLATLTKPEDGVYTPYIATFCTKSSELILCGKIVQYNHVYPTVLWVL